MRCFLAVELPQAQKATVMAGLARLKGKLPAARWVRPEGLHITLKFLGEQSEAQAASFLEALTQLLTEVPPEVKVSLHGGGFFPNAARPRVAWLGGQAPGLEAWAEASEEAASLIGVARETRPFSLHVTLARLERPWPEGACQRFLQEVASWQLAPFVAREVVLFESTLGPGGAVYSERARIPVGRP